jgi:tetratricopeptide (TPR) repeat protein
VFVAGVYHELVGTLMLTVYLTWSPWHYTGQNYGIAVMFIQRTGADPPRRPKRWLYASFLLSYALTFLVLHSGDGARMDTFENFEGTGIQFMTLGIPDSFSAVALPVLGICYLITLAGAARELLRIASPRELLPVAILCLTQALWFSVPEAARYWNLAGGFEVLNPDFRANYFLWIALGHSVQYLWVTSYYAKAAGSRHGQGWYYGKILLAGNVAWMLPAALFGPGLLGGTPDDAGFGLLVASLVNIHHFILDGAIWKLRNSRIADLLIRAPERGAQQDQAAVSRRSWPAALAWSILALCLLASFAEFWDRQVNRPERMSQRDFAGVSASLDRSAWIGRDSARRRVMIGHSLAKAGDHAAARREYERSIALHPGAAAFDGLGQLHALEGNWTEALVDFERGLEISPNNAELLARAGMAQMALGRLEEGRALFEQAVKANPDSKLSRAGLSKSQELIELRQQGAY